ncbi:hypothetical protein N566_05545 [Streptomycetaceae bacterium MP113-05]|nr:hypothetical protein N566_05545 [Streptomycetaceae bacterium MP113-05]
MLLLTRRGDREATGLALLLRRVGVPVRRLDADGLEHAEIFLGPGPEVAVNDAVFAPTVTWVRHFSLRAAPRTRPDGEQLLHQDSWTTLAEHLPLISGVTLGDDDPGQMWQRAQASALGVRIPDGLVTTDPVTAAARLPTSRRYVVKVLDRHYVEPEPGRFTWFLPHVVDAPLPLRSLGLPDGTPVMVQEYVEHDTEFRVYVVGTDVIAFEVAKDDPGDVWRHPERVRVRPSAAPPAVTAAVRRLARAWGLRYGAFDFLVDRGEPVFLEMNAHGDWSWFESRSGVDTVTRAAARTVRDLHWAAAGRSGPPATAVLTFLGAGPDD